MWKVYVNLARCSWVVFSVCYSCRCQRLQFPVVTLFFSPSLLSLVFWELLLKNCGKKPHHIKFTLSTISKYIVQYRQPHADCHAADPQNLPIRNEIQHPLNTYSLPLTPLSPWQPPFSFCVCKSDCFRYLV